MIKPGEPSMRKSCFQIILNRKIYPQLGIPFVIKISAKEERRS
ncbi:MAG: hypothetical protein ACFFDN_43580 [Candidatus Hodarchaeota archaeon]